MSFHVASAGIMRTSNLIKYLYICIMNRGKIFGRYDSGALAYLLLSLLILCYTPASWGKTDRYKEYIERYSAMAESEMAEFGIPASITLAQGLLESAAGASTLAREGNNHFGIKCHNSWNGATMLRNDDAPDECFRVYDDAANSFRDHSLFLTRKRYASLFLLDPTDYSAWAHGLKKCGYATDPHYADRLIAIVERYELYRFDTPGNKRLEADVEFIKGVLGKSRRVCRYRGLHYIVASPGDTYSSLAKEMNIDASKLAIYNDSDNPDAEIKAWEEVYLQPKLTTSPDDTRTATIGQDETIHSVAQRFAMTVKTIIALNPKAKDRPGTRLKLR